MVFTHTNHCLFVHCRCYGLWLVGAQKAAKLHGLTNVGRLTLLLLLGQSSQERINCHKEG